ncbi:aminoacyl-tRNA hydrolase [Iamia majanohamensis]|uniref:Peptidyl-tRNA hydrolase n=1 Tax=Iamia majanohamensis TaxID=467976 RepID=A0AAE9Y7W9_9ACTN|nr:aminoacyl-tRNA hydrolase [Iamia majanohamensis]WCO68419.1 aminoacyl-tRNA hydrolase [Iamia majanohamensis]
MPVDLLVVGLGNPGMDYARTRHNVGADTVGLLAERHGGRLKVAFRNERAQSDEVRVGTVRIGLAIPETFYNESGVAVGALVRRHDLEDLHRVVVVHDELDLPPGRLKLKLGGGLAGNNGLRSIKAHLHTEDFARVRIGVGKPPGRQQGADHVLRRPGKAERAELDVAIEEAADAVEAIATDGIEAAMGRYNTRPDPA